MWGSSPSQHLNLKVVLTLLFILSSNTELYLFIFWSHLTISWQWLLGSVPSFIFTIPRTRLARDKCCSYKSCCLFASLNHKKKKHEEQPARRPTTIKKKKGKRTTFTSGDPCFAAGSQPVYIIHDAFFSWWYEVWGWSGIQEAGERVNGWWWWAGPRQQPEGSEGAHVSAAPFHSVTVGFMRRPWLMDGTPLKAPHTYCAPDWAWPRPKCSCSSEGQRLTRRAAWTSAHRAHK